MKKIVLKKEIKYILLYMIAFFFINRFFDYEIFKKIQILKLVYTNFSRLVFIFIIVYWLKSKIYKKDLKLLMLLSVYFVLILGTTIINNGSIRSVIMISYPIIGTILLFSIGVHKNKESLIKAFVWLFYILVIINFLDAILFKDLSSEYSTNYFFLAGKNQLAVSFAVGFSFIKIYYEKNKTKKRRFLLISYLIIISLTAIFSKSGTCIISIALLLGLNYFSFLKKITTPFNIFIGYLIFFIGIIIFQIQNYFKFLIVDILHKDITFTYRTIIWEKALEEIKKFPLFGHGVHQDINYFQVKLFYSGGEFLHNFTAHNQIIQHLYEFGILTTLVLIYIYFFCCFRKNKNKNFIYIFNTIIVIFITCFAEVIGIYAILVMLAFCYYSKEIE